MKSLVTILLVLASSYALGAGHPDDGIYLRSQDDCRPGIMSQDGQEPMGGGASHFTPPLLLFPVFARQRSLKSPDPMAFRTRLFLRGKSVKIALLAGWMLFLLASCSSGYGPLQDYSRFVSAKLADDRKRILFSYHHFTYRPAAGWRAFPDGGVPKVLKDANLIGIFDLSRQKVNILRREINSDWQPGSGLYTIQAMKGDKALLAQGGQLRGPFKLGVRYLLLDLVLGSATPLDLMGDLARIGKALGEIHLVDPDGAILFITLPLTTAKDAGAFRTNSEEKEIWLRTPAGDFLKVAASSHYETVRNGEVIYWVPATRKFQAFSIFTRQTRAAPEFRPADYVEVAEQVILSTNQKGLEYGVKAGGVWRYQPVELTPQMWR